MRKLILILAAVIGSLAMQGHDGPKKKEGDKYCARMKDGMMRVMHENHPITTTIVLHDGTQIKTDGTVIRKDGTHYVLKEGECVDKDGNIGESPAQRK
jgi:hypothetical protein